MGLYLVTTGPLTAGQILGPADIRRESGELTAQEIYQRVNPSVVTVTSRWPNRELMKPLT